MSSSASTTPSTSASASSSASATGASAALNTASSTLGPILVDGTGRVLYLFEADTSSKSTCSGSCAAAWPPLLTSGTPTGGQGVKANLLGTTTRSDGTTQVTYNGHPLYYYAGDSKAGDMNGQDISQFGAKWYVLDANGVKVEKG